MSSALLRCMEVSFCLPKSPPSLNASSRAVLNDDARWDCSRRTRAGSIIPVRLRCGDFGGRVLGDPVDSELELATSLSTCIFSSEPCESARALIVSFLLSSSLDGRLVTGEATLSVDSLNFLVGRLVIGEEACSENREDGTDG